MTESNEAPFGYTAFVGRRTDIEGALGVGDMYKGRRVVLCAKGSDRRLRMRVHAVPMKGRDGWQVKLQSAIRGRGAQTEYSKSVRGYRLGLLGLAPISTIYDKQVKWADDYVLDDESAAESQE